MDTIYSDLLVEILMYVSLEDLIQVGRINKNFRLRCLNSKLWQHRYDLYLKPHLKSFQESCGLRYGKIYGEHGLLLYVCEFLYVIHNTNYNIFDLIGLPQKLVEFMKLEKLS